MFLHCKFLIRPENSIDDSELARKIVHNWEEGLSTVNHDFLCFFT